MTSSFRRTLVVVGCAAALWGGSQALSLAASEPLPPTPVSGEGKLASALLVEEDAGKRLLATERQQAFVAAKIDVETSSLAQEVAAGRSMLSAASGRAGVFAPSLAPAVQTVTGASGGGGDDSGQGDD